VGLLDTSSGRSGLLGSLGSELLSGTGRQAVDVKLGGWIRVGVVEVGTHAFPPVDFRAVCLVRAIVDKSWRVGDWYRGEGGENKSRLVVCW
jgi:hypothetical protein